MSHVIVNPAESSKPKAPSALRQRLLQDINELQSKPYPNITLHVSDENFTEVCLCLNVETYGPMHLTVDFPSDYPLKPPIIKMDSEVVHPNIFGTYICASILNTEEGYTPAYTLKGIAIQMLSFFGSDNIEQVQYGNNLTSRVENLKYYKMSQEYVIDDYTCAKCNFGKNKDLVVSGHLHANVQAMDPISGEETAVHRSTLAEVQSTFSDSKKAQSTELSSLPPIQHDPIATGVPAENALSKIQQAALPDEILLLICGKLETEDLMVFAQAWGKIGAIITGYDLIRTRELQCFVFKKDYLSTKLGVGVTTRAAGARKGFFESEFDLLSKDAFGTHHIRRSVLGVDFEHWLPLPISRGHWRKVKDDSVASLIALANGINLGLGKIATPIDVVYHFMNDVVVKLNKQTEEITSHAPYLPQQGVSTLTHASEKAIESYFHLFHLFLCMAVEQPSIVTSANERLDRFMEGKTSKEFCPNLGHLLIAVLISDREIDQEVMNAIVKETITRNTVWMLDKKGANMPELAFMESSPVSEYRLEKSFEACKTSYRLLMFLNLFRKVAVGSPRKPLATLCDEAFDRHGAPPRGSAKHLADSIKCIHAISTFPEFLDSMGIERPSASTWTTFLRTCMEDSVKKGYSSMPLSQGEALYLRLEKEPDVEQGDIYSRYVNVHRLSFFPRPPGPTSQDTGRGRGQGYGQSQGYGRGQGYGQSQSQSQGRDLVWRRGGRR